MVERQSSTSRSHERSCDVRTELDGDPEGDDQVYEGDSVETDPPDSHHSHDFEDGQSTGEGDDGSGSPRSKEEGGDEEDGDEGEGEDFDGDGDDVGVLRSREEKRKESSVRS